MCMGHLGRWPSFSRPLLARSQALHYFKKHVFALANRNDIQRGGLGGAPVWFPGTYVFCGDVVALGDLLVEFLDVRETRDNACGRAMRLLAVED